jgi:hypothetical protein
VKTRTWRVIAYRDAFGLIWEPSERFPTYWTAVGIAEAYTLDRLKAERPGLVPVEVDDQEALLAEVERLRRDLNAAMARVSALEAEVEPARVLLASRPTGWPGETQKNR